jgi:hypothetical protein
LNRYRPIISFPFPAACPRSPVNIPCLLSSILSLCASLGSPNSTFLATTLHFPFPIRATNM